MKLTVYKDKKIYRDLDLSDEFDLSSAYDRVEFYIGRADDCHVHLEGSEISRHHLIFARENGKWKVSNISPFGELYINGNEVKESSLNNGDMLALQNYQIDIELEDNNAQAPISAAEDPILVPEQGETVTINNSSDELELDSESETEPENDNPQEEETPSQEMDGGIKEEIEEGPAEDEGNKEFELDSDFGEISLSADASESELESEIEEEGDEESESDQGDVDDDQELGQLNFDDSSLDLNLDASAGEENSAGEEFSAEPTNDFLDDGNALALLEDEDQTKVLQNFAQYGLELFGQYAPYDQYNLDSDLTVIGRDVQKCQIILQDPEVSVLHAQIRREGALYLLEDLNSSNGTILNGSRINKAEITNGDEFLIGSTNFTVRIRSEMIKSEQDHLMPVDPSQVVEIEEIVEVDEDFPEEKSFSTNKSLFTKDALKNPEKRKKILIILVVLLGLWTLLEEQESTNSPPAQASKEQKTTPKEVVAEDPKGARIVLTEEQRNNLNARYLLAQRYLEEGKYREALATLDEIFKVTNEFERARDFESFAKQKLAELEDQERKLQQAKDKEIREARVAELLEKAEEAVKEKNVSPAKALFSQIRELDPENFKVGQLELELDAWIKEQERLKVEQTQKEAERRRMMQALQPGKNLFLQKKWFESIIELETFLTLKSIDEDLIVEATEMLEKARFALEEDLSPLLSKARSFQEGQDLKNAYETYGEVLEVQPTNEEASRQRNNIREDLETRAMRVYREALISESLSLFDDAKEKFQQVQQIAPMDSEYYQKATRKLKNYLY